MLSIDERIEKVFQVFHVFEEFLIVWRSVAGFLNPQSVVKRVLKRLLRMGTY